MGRDRSDTARRWGAAVGAVAAAALAGPAGTIAAPAVLAPVDVSAAGGAAGAPLAGMAGDGEVVVVWESRGAGGATVMAATRAPGGPLSPPVPLSATGDGASPALAVAPSGEALAAWRRTAAGDVVRVVGRAPGGAFGGPADLSEPGAFAPRAAIARGGGAVVAWLRFDPEAGAIVVEMARRAPGGAFTAPERVSGAGGDALALTAAVDADGRVAVAWNQSDGRTSTVWSAVGTLAGGLGAPMALSVAGRDAYDPRVALTPSGTALVAWTGSDGADTRIQLAEIVGGVAGEPAALSAAGASAAEPRLAVDGGGTAVVAWRRGAPGGDRVQASVRPPGGPAGPPADLSAAGSPAAEPAIAVDAAGRVAVAWRRADGSDPRVQVATRDPGAAAAVGADVSTRGVVVDDPGVALDGAGNGVVVWRRAAGADDIVQMAGLDDAPPVLTEVGVPAAAVVGEPVRLSVRARDVWSALAPGPTWSFAADVGAVGASVEHAFPAPGDYTVRVVQADAVGRVAVAERRVGVSAPPAALAAPPAASGSRRPAARRPVALRVGWSWVRDGGRVWLRVRGVTSPRLRGRAVVVERRVPGRMIVLCRVPVRRAGVVDGLCRVDRLARAGRIVLRVRARVPRGRATRARVLRHVIRPVAAAPPPRAPAR